jgi:hypothetical protein
MALKVPQAGGNANQTGKKMRPPLPIRFKATTGFNFTCPQ